MCVCVVVGPMLRLLWTEQSSNRLIFNNEELAALRMNNEQKQREKKKKVFLFFCFPFGFGSRSILMQKKKSS